MQRDPAGTQQTPAMARNVSSSQFTQPDPVAQYADGMNLYQYVKSNPIMGRDPTGLAEDRTECSGVCGGKIDNWIGDEISAQVAGIQKAFGGKKPSFGDYLEWANGNQRYKDADFFAFSKGVEGCGTKPDKNKPGCGYSVTVCKKCVRSAILGNIMFGYIGRQLGFTKEDLRQASAVKRRYGMTVDKYDEAAYDLGFDLQGKFTPKGSIDDFCSQLDELLKNNADALKEGKKGGGYNDLSTCKLCPKDTKEKRHGGNENSRLTP
jgi:RHS repeat-associated protein